MPSGMQPSTFKRCLSYVAASGLFSFSPLPHLGGVPLGPLWPTSKTKWASPNSPPLSDLHPLVHFGPDESTKEVCQDSASVYIVPAYAFLVELFKSNKWDKWARHP